MESDESVKEMEAYFNAKFEEKIMLPSEDNSNGISSDPCMILKSIDDEHAFVIFVTNDEWVIYKFRINK